MADFEPRRLTVSDPWVVAGGQTARAGGESHGSRASDTERRERLIVHQAEMAITFVASEIQGRRVRTGIRGYRMF